jgi:hypothetical protein
MATTARHGFFKWAAGLTQSDTILNDLLEKLEIKLNASVVSRTVTAEPGSPSGGDMYILGATHTGTDWGGYAQHDIAYYDGTAWSNLTPIEGMQAVVADDDEIVVFNAAAWGPFAALTLASKINDPSGGGTIDAEARTAIGSIIDALEGHYISTP